MAHSLRDALNKHKGSRFGLLKIDFKNAFNMVSREHFMKLSGEMFPAICRLGLMLWDANDAALRS